MIMSSTTIVSCEPQSERRAAAHQLGPMNAISFSRSRRPSWRRFPSPRLPHAQSLAPAVPTFVGVSLVGIDLRFVLAFGDPRVQRLVVVAGFVPAAIGFCCYRPAAAGLGYPSVSCIVC